MVNMRFDILANLDSKEAAERVDQLRLKMEELGDLHIRGEIDDAEFKAQIREIKGELDALADKHPDVKVRASAARAIADLREVKAEARELDNKTVRIPVDLTDTKAAAERIADLRRQLETLRNQHLKADIDTAEFKVRTREIKDQLDALSTKHPDIPVRVEATRALAELTAFNREIDRIDRKNVRVRVDDEGTTSLFTGNTRLLIAAGLAIGPAIAAGVAPGLAALAAVGATAGAAAQGIGVLAIAFSGIGKGVKELGQEQLATAGKVEQSAAQQISSANSIANAQDSLRSAVDNVGATQENSALAVRRALEQEESAHLAVDQAVRREHDAELSLVDAQRSALRAQQDLTQARQDAERSLQDMANSVIDNGLAQRRAQKDLDQARAALGNIATDDPRREDAELALEERQQRLNELQLQGQRLAQDKRTADAAGVEGSRQVTSAQDALTAANQRVTDSQQAVYDSTLAITQAQQRERDAVEEVTRARVTGDRQVAAAHQAVIQADRALQSATAAQAAQLAGTSAAAAKLTRDLDDLSPAGQHFARFLHDDLIPGLKGIRDEVQAGALPDFELALRLLAQGAPAANAGLKGTAAVVGDLSVRGARMMISGPWQRDFALIMAANNKALMGWGNAGLSALDVGRNLTAAAIPLELHFAGVAEESLAMFEAWIQGKRDSGELAMWFHEMQDELALIGHVLGQVVEGGYHLFQTLSPLGGVTLELTGDLAQFVGWLSQVNPGLVQAIAVTAALYPWVSRLGNAYEALSKVGPAVASMIANTAVNAGALTEKFTGSETASGRVTNAVSRLGTVLGVAGVAVAGYAIAWQNAQAQADQWADAIMKGGAVAEAANAQIRESDAEYDHWYNWIGKISRAIDVGNPSLDEMRQKVADLRAEMDPLTRAQSLATEAQNNYARAVERQDWAGARSAQQQFATQTAEVARQQKILKDGLESTTDALKRQQEQALGVSDADIRYGDALKRATDSAKEHGKTLDTNTEHGRRNQEAFNDLVRAMMAQEEQMRKSGDSEQVLNATHEQHRVQLRNVATQMGLNQAEAQKLTDKYFGIPTSITTTFFAATPPAIAAVADMGVKIGDALRNIQDERITIAFTAPGTVAGETQAIARSIPRAMGGPIFGPGTETSDDIPVMASHNEHMWTGREVRGAGGHGTVIRLRQLAAAGLLPRFAAGGPIDWSTTITPGVEGIADVVARNVAYVREQLATMVAQTPPAGPVGAGVARWAAMVDQALGIMHQPLAYEGITLRRMNQESGGNPTIVNKWDSNWAKGTPSVGLMQVIGPTYRANQVIDVGPYLYGVSVDPLANTLASMKYAIGRYGSLPAAYNKAGGYADGGIVTTPTLAHVAEGGAPEAIIPLTRPARAAAIMNQAGLGGATVNVGPVHVHGDVDVDLLAQRLAFSAASAGL